MRDAVALVYSLRTTTVSLHLFPLSLSKVLTFPTSRFFPFLSFPFFFPSSRRVLLLSSSSSLTSSFTRSLWWRVNSHPLDRDIGLSPGQGFSGREGTGRKLRGRGEENDARDRKEYIIETIVTRKAETKRSERRNSAIPIPRRLLFFHLFREGRQ